MPLPGCELSILDSTHAGDDEWEFPQTPGSLKGPASAKLWGSAAADPAITPLPPSQPAGRAVSCGATAGRVRAPCFVKLAIKCLSTRIGLCSPMRSMLVCDISRPDMPKSCVLCCALHWDLSSAIGIGQSCACHLLQELAVRRTASARQIVITILLVASLLTGVGLLALYNLPWLMMMSSWQQLHTGHDPLSIPAPAMQNESNALVSLKCYASKI